MSELTCVLIPGHQVHPGEEVVLDARESHHLVRVRRLAEGDEVWAIVGDGTAARCLLQVPDQRQACLSVEEVVADWREPVRRVTLFQAIVRGQQMDRIVESGCALGLFSLVPLLTTRVERRNARLDRLQRLAAESAKQCGRGRIPTIAPIMDWIAFMARPNRETLLTAHAEAEETLSEMLSGGEPAVGREVCLVVGPEGDFTPLERTQLRDKGALEVGLGPRRLRSEDAALMALSLLLSS